MGKAEGSGEIGNGTVVTLRYDFATEIIKSHGCSFIHEQAPVPNRGSFSSSSLFQ